MKTYGYGHQSITEADVDSVVEVLRGDYLTCGPAVRAFEQAICAYTGAKYCVAVANATAGLHIAALAAGLGLGDEAITSPITFLSSANCIAFTGAKPVFADIDAHTADIDPDEIEKRITSRTKALVPVHFAGQSCDMKRIATLAKCHGIKVIEDAAHAIGSDYGDTKVGSCAYSDMTVFSFHPVKTITTGEGGAVTVSGGDSYYAFKKQLDRFVQFLRTGKADHPFEDTIEMAKIIAAGIRSREEGGRRVYLSELNVD